MAARIAGFGRQGAHPSSIDRCRSAIEATQGQSARASAKCGSTTAGIPGAFRQSGQSRRSALPRRQADPERRHREGQGSEGVEQWRRLRSHSPRSMIAFDVWRKPALRWRRPAGGRDDRSARGLSALPRHGLSPCLAPSSGFATHDPANPFVLGRRRLKGRNSGLVGFALFGRLFSETMQSRTVTRVTARRSESWLRER